MMLRRALAKPAVLAAASLVAMGLSSGVALGTTDASGATRVAPSFVAKAHSYLPEARFLQAATLLAQRHVQPSPPHSESTAPRPTLVARITRPLPITSKPGGHDVIGTIPTVSRYLDQPLTAWVEDITPDRRFGKVPVPFTGTSSTGWIRLAGLQLDHTRYSVQIDRSRHLLSVLRLGKVIMRFPAATGAPTSPTPTGRFFVTDRVPIPAGGSFGTYAFGLSGLQPNLPAGWSGGDQLAIHGTDDPASIGTSSSAGCVRVSEAALARLEPLLLPGTPVIVVP